LRQLNLALYRRNPAQLLSHIRRIYPPITLFRLIGDAGMHPALCPLLPVKKFSFQDNGLIIFLRDPREPLQELFAIPAATAAGDPPFTTT